MSLRRNVELSRAEQRALVYNIETVGVIEAEGMTDLAAGVHGVVDEVNFREGDEVSPDQAEPLVKVDQRSYLASMRLAEASVLKAEANLSLAKDRLDRVTRAGQGSSAQEREEARLLLNAVTAELEAARAGVQIAQQNLDRSQVRPPYKGRINKRMVTPGMYLEDKTIIATMADLSHLRLVAYVPETAAAAVRELMAQQELRSRAITITLPLGGWLAGPPPWAALAAEDAIRRGDVPSGFDPEFTVLSFPNRIFRAKVFYLSTVAEPSTHMFECKAEIDLTGTAADLKPGFTARVRFPIRSNPFACIVPEEAVRATERGFTVYEPVPQSGPDGLPVTDADGKPQYQARARVVEVGYRSPGFVEIKQGVVPGQWIVRRGADALEDGSPIRIVGPRPDR